MPKFVYQPEGVKKPKKWDFDPTRLMSPEAEAIERHTQMTYADWAQAVEGGSILALHGLLYVLLKRDDPTLKWDAVVFSLSEIDWELSADEIATGIETLEAQAASGPLSPNDSAVLESLRADQEKASAEAAPKG